MRRPEPVTKKEETSKNEEQVEAPEVVELEEKPDKSDDTPVKTDDEVVE